MTTFLSVPSTIVQGDSLNLQLSYDTYPSTDFTGSFNLRGPSTLTLTGTPTGSGAFSFLLLPASASLITSGTYDYSVTVSSPTERQTVATGFIRVLPDISTTGAVINDLEAKYNAINAVLTGRITADVQSVTINGRSITKIPHKDLWDLRAIIGNQLARLTGNKTGVKAFSISFGGTR